MAEDTSSVSKPMMSIETVMNNLDTTVTSTQEIRQALLEKLVPAALKIKLDIDEGTNSDLLASETRFIEQVRQLLNDQDNAAKNHASMKLKKVEQEDQQKTRINVVELLGQIQANTAAWRSNDPNTPVIQSEEELELELAKVAKANAIEVLDTELETSSNNLPETKANSSNPLEKMELEADTKNN